MGAGAVRPPPTAASANHCLGRPRTVGAGSTGWCRCGGWHNREGLHLSRGAQCRWVRRKNARFGGGHSTLRPSQAFGAQLFLAWERAASHHDAPAPPRRVRHPLGRQAPSGRARGSVVRGLSEEQGNAQASPDSAVDSPAAYPPGRSNSSWDPGSGR